MCKQQHLCWVFFTHVTINYAQHSLYIKIRLGDVRFGRLIMHEAPMRRRTKEEIGGEGEVELHQAASILLLFNVM